MDQRQRTKRFGLYMILCACLLRLALADWKMPFPTYSETGRNVRFSASSDEFFDFFRESPPPWLPEPERPRFEAADAQRVDVDYDCSLRPDLAALTEMPLSWDLTAGEPSVLILHTHTTESYTKSGEAYEETARYRTLEENYNMVSIGDAVEEILQQAGISVIHDRQLHDYPSYSGSYVHARSTTAETLEKYPSIRLVMDLHRDAVEKDGRQLRPLVSASEATAQLMMVVGTNVSRQSHEKWEENLALALKLHIQLERETPGIMRPLNLRAQRFNQDLNPGALLVEVGAAGNTHEEALAAAKRLAWAVVALARGTE